MYSCKDKVSLFVQDDYCGSVYLIITQDSLLQEKIIIDSNGIGYVSEKQLIHDGVFNKVDVYESNSKKKITEDCINIGEGYFTSNSSFKSYHYLFFYVKCNNEDYTNYSGADIIIELKGLIDSGIIR